MTTINLHEYLENIERLLSESRLYEVEGHCRHILSQFPRHIPTYRVLAKALLEKEAYNDAADLFQRVLSADPGDLIAHIGLSDIYKEESLLQQAVWHLERAHEAEPYNKAIQAELRDLYQQSGIPVPQRIPVLVGGAARLHLRAEMYQQAVTVLKDALAEEPDRADLLILLAEAYWRDNQRVDAVDVCRRILDELPNCITANAILGEIWLVTGRIDEAQPYLQNVLSLTQVDELHLDVETAVGRALTTEGAPPVPQSVTIKFWEDTSGEQGTTAQADWVSAVATRDSYAEEMAASDATYDWLSGLSFDESDVPEPASLSADKDTEPEPLEANWLVDEPQADKELLAGLDLDTAVPPEDEDADWLKQLDEPVSKFTAPQTGSFDWLDEETNEPATAQEVPQTDSFGWLDSQSGDDTDTPQQPPAQPKIELPQADNTAQVPDWLLEVESGDSALLPLDSDELQFDEPVFESEQEAAADTMPAPLEGDAPEWLAAATTGTDWLTDADDDWLAADEEKPEEELAEPETAVPPTPTISPAQATADVPDWLLSTEMDEEDIHTLAEKAVSENKTLTDEYFGEDVPEPDWLAEETSPEEDVFPALQAEAFPEEQDENVPDWLMDNSAEISPELEKAMLPEPDDTPMAEPDDFDRDASDELDDAMSWLDEISDEERPLPENDAEATQSQDSDELELPDWLTADIEDETASELVDLLGEETHLEEEPTLDEAELDMPMTDSEADEIDDWLSFASDDGLDDLGLEDLAGETGDLTELLQAAGDFSMEPDADDALLNAEMAEIAEMEDEGDALPAEEIPDWLQNLAPKQEEQPTNEADDDLDWLARIAAGEGEPLDEPPTQLDAFASQDFAGEEPEVEDSWLAAMAEPELPQPAIEDLPTWKWDTDADDTSLSKLTAVPGEEPVDEPDSEEQWFTALAAPEETAEPAIDTPEQPIIVDENPTMPEKMPGSIEELDEALADELDWLENLAMEQESPDDLLPTALNELDSYLDEGEPETAVPARDEAETPQEDELDELSLTALLADTDLGDTDDTLDAFDTLIEDSEGVGLDWLEDFGPETAEPEKPEEEPAIPEPELEPDAEFVDETPSWLEEMAAQESDASLPEDVDAKEEAEATPESLTALFAEIEQEENLPSESSEEEIPESLTALFAEVEQEESLPSISSEKEGEFSGLTALFAEADEEPASESDLELPDWLDEEGEPETAVPEPALDAIEESADELDDLFATTPADDLELPDWLDKEDEPETAVPEPALDAIEESADELDDLFATTPADDLELPDWLDEEDEPKTAVPEPALDAIEESADELDDLFATTPADEADESAELEDLFADDLEDAPDFDDDWALVGEETAVAEEQHTGFTDALKDLDSAETWLTDLSATATRELPEVGDPANQTPALDPNLAEALDWLEAQEPIEADTPVSITVDETELSQSLDYLTQLALAPEPEPEEEPQPKQAGPDEALMLLDDLLEEDADDFFSEEPELLTNAELDLETVVKERDTAVTEAPPAIDDETVLEEPATEQEEEDPLAMLESLLAADDLDFSLDEDAPPIEPGEADEDFGFFGAPARKPAPPAEPEPAPTAEVEPELAAEPETMVEPEMDEETAVPEPEPPQLTEEEEEDPLAMLESLLAADDLDFSLDEDAPPIEPGEADEDFGFFGAPARKPAPPAEPEPAPAAEVEPEPAAEPETAVPLTDEDIFSDMPEDPDEQFAWLEKMAARQGVPDEELLTVQKDSQPEDIAASKATEPAKEIAEELLSGLEESPELEMLADAETAVPDWLLPDAEEDDETGLQTGWLRTLPELDANSWLVEQEEVVAKGIDETIVPSINKPAETSSLPEMAPAPPPTFMPESEPEPMDSLILPVDEPISSALVADSETLAKARKAIATGDVDRALTHYQQLVEKGDGLITVITDLETAVESHPHNPDIPRLLGDAYMRNGQLQKALSLYRLALDQL